MPVDLTPVNPSLLEPRDGHYTVRDEKRRQKHFLRKIPNLFRTIISFLNSCFKTISHNPEAPITPGIHHLRVTRMLGSSAIQEYGEYLESEYNTISIDKRFCLPMPKSNDLQALLPKREDIKKDLQAFPVQIGKHIVCVMVNFTNQQIEYYDPQGLSVLDRADSRMASLPFTLKDFVDAVIEKYGFEHKKVLENTTIHQRDCHNCGVYVLDFIERRAKGYTFEKIIANGKNFSEVNQKLRAQMIHNLCIHKTVESSPQIRRQVWDL